MPDRLPLPAGLGGADGSGAQVRIRVNRRARRIGLRIDPIAGEPVLTLPRPSDLQRGLAFLEQQRDWLARQMAALPPGRPFVDGAEIPYRGQPHRLRHVPALTGRPRIVNGEILVGGAAEHMARRTREGLSREARDFIAPHAHVLAQRIGQRVTGISIRDQRTRWGSCSASGRLNFSWRLVLAPPAVLDYVVAHEVAHLAHHDHGPSFWALVERLQPDFAAHRGWLREHGAALQRVG